MRGRRGRGRGRRRQHLHGDRRGRREGAQGRAAGAAGRRASPSSSSPGVSLRSMPTGCERWASASWSKPTRSRGRARVSRSCSGSTRTPARQPDARDPSGRGVPHARAAQDRGRLRQLLHVLHRAATRAACPRGVAAGGRGRGGRSARRGRYARDRAHRHQHRPLPRSAEPGADLADLVAAVAATGVARLRLSSIEPPDLTERLLGVLARDAGGLRAPARAAAERQRRGPLGDGPHVHRRAVRASGSPLPARPLPGLAVTTDVIAGFPGETDRAARRDARVRRARWASRSCTCSATARGRARRRPTWCRSRRRCARRGRPSCASSATELRERATSRAESAVRRRGARRARRRRAWRRAPRATTCGSSARDGASARRDARRGRSTRADVLLG